MAKEREEDRYLKPDDVRMRLDETVVFYKGNPFYARTTGMSLKLYVPESLFAQSVHTINANSSNIDLESPKLGFMNWAETNALYVSRIPCKRFKQGLNSSNLVYYSILQETTKTGAITFATSLLLSFQFFEMLRNKYLPLQEILERFEKVSVSPNCRAVSKDFALAKIYTKTYLYFHLSRIGELIPGTSMFNIYGKYKNSLLAQKLHSAGIFAP